MTPEQKARLQALHAAMVNVARRQPTENAKNKALNVAHALQDFLHGNPSDRTAEEWIAVAEEAIRRAAH